jgi:hypothetical protein
VNGSVWTGVCERECVNGSVWTSVCERVCVNECVYVKYLSEYV